MFDLYKSSSSSDIKKTEQERKKESLKFYLSLEHPKYNRKDLRMKTEERIKHKITYLKGYIDGQEDSHAPFEEEVNAAKIIVKALEEILEEDKGGE